LSVARFTFDGVADRRAYVDAARLFSRLVRNVDFACREQDGSILAAFTKTDLRSAHLVARRIASVLRRTMLSPGRDRRAIRPTIPPPGPSPPEDAGTLGARRGPHPRVAAEGGRASPRGPAGGARHERSPANRDGVRRRLPVVLYRQAPAGKGD